MRGPILNFGDSESGINIKNWDDLLTQMPNSCLKKAQIFFYLAFPIYGAIALACGIYQGADTLLISCGAVAILFPILIRYCPVAFKVFYTLWFSLSMLLILIGLALMETHKGFSDSFFALGGIFLGVLFCSPCVGCNVLATRRDAVSRASDLAVVFQALKDDIV